MSIIAFLRSVKANQKYEQELRKSETKIN